MTVEQINSPNAKVNRLNREIQSEMPEIMNEIMILLLKVIYRFDAVKARETPMTLLPEVGQKQSQ